MRATTEIIHRRSLLLLACLAAALTLMIGADPATPAPERTAVKSIESRFVERVQPFLSTYCFTCHGSGKSKGDLTLDRFKTWQDVQSDRRTWLHIVDMLGQNLMPPEGRKQPSNEAKNEVVAWIKETLNYHDCSGPRDPGYVAIRRLNRVEYNNTIRDLIGVDFEPANDFPADDTGYGFDNIADVLTMSPLLAEKYLAAAEQILDKAIMAENPFKRAVRRYPSNSLTAEGDNNGGSLMVEGPCFAEHEFVADGEYEIRIRAGQDPFGPDPARMTVSIDDKPLETFDVKAPRGKAQYYALAVPVKAGKRKVGAAYINNYVVREGRNRGDRNLHVEVIEVDGPINAAPPPPPASHRRLLDTPPTVKGDDARAKFVIERFASRAFRRPAKGEELDGLFQLYRLARDEGDKFEHAIKLPLAAVLCSPHFLFRIELDPQKDRHVPHPITDHELATRLSYFLWSSMPDDALLGLADAGKLREPAELERQVKRMLADSKAEALVENFAGQWLELRNLHAWTPDPEKFPDFDDELRSAMLREAELFVANLIKEDRSVLELLDSDYTFLNERLAKHYGIKGIKGDDFRRVPLVKDSPRGGVITTAAVMTVTAMPTRTSPVKRGKFILEQILGTPPPPPPPDVPALSEKAQDISSAPLRERLEKHRADPNCAVCHIRMDAIGFSLENFDPLGAWRTSDGKFPIDPSGSLPDGEKLNGPDDLKRVLLSSKSEFLHCLTEKMLTYALGRGMEQHDVCTIKDVVKHAGENGHRFSALIMGVVQSDAFLKRRGKTGT